MSLISLYSLAADRPCVSLLDMSREELAVLLTGMGEPAYRAAQIWEWGYHRYAGGFAVMTTLPASLRQQLAAQTTIDPLTPVTTLVSHAGDTQKVLFAL